MLVRRIHYPRRLLAALTGATLTGAGLIPAVMPGIILPSAIWQLAYIVGGITLVACAVWPATPLNVRATGSFVVAVALAASVVEVVLEVVSGVRTFPRLLLSVAFIGTLGAHTVALLAYWHRLDPLE